MSELIEKILTEALELSVFDKVNQLIMAGGQKNWTFSNKEKEFLKQTVTKNTYELFRGIYFMRFRVSKEYWAFTNQLKVGDILPDFLKKQAFSNDYVSYSKKINVAKSYGKEGDISMIVQIKDTGSNILIDLENIKLLKGAIDYFDLNDLNYMKKEKEVIVHERNLNPVIIYKEGKL